MIPGIIAGGSGGFVSRKGALLHFNGSNGSTTFQDESGKTWTAHGDAKISTAQSVFGGASGQFDGTGDYIDTASSPDWAFGLGDFVIKFRFRTSNVGKAAQTIVGNYTDATTGWYVQYRNFGGFQGIRFGGRGDASPEDFAWVPSSDTWYAVCVSRSGTSLRAFIDGNQIGSTATNTQDIDASQSVVVGAIATFFSQGVEGFVDELLIDKGASVTANYTPEGSEFVW